MYTVVCYFDNRKLRECNIIGRYNDLKEAKEVFKRECEDKKEYLVFANTFLAIFCIKYEHYIIELMNQKCFNLRKDM